MPWASAPKRAVGRGVAVAADDGHAGLGAALLGADHVDDALADVAQVESSMPASLQFLVIVQQPPMVGDRARPSSGGRA